MYREIKYREIAADSLKLVTINLINDNLSGLSWKVNFREITVDHL